MSLIRADADVLERKILEPDPGLIKSLGTHHTLQSAVADLVDNSVDAGADRVLIRFDTDGHHPVALTVIDNGRGMAGGQVDEAMRLGRQRAYASSDQGHFGIGLKAASFSHAATLTVMTTRQPGDYHGRRLRKDDVQRDYGCDVLDPATLSAELDRYLSRIGAQTGTAVRWTDTRFPRSTVGGLSNWLEDSRTLLRMHLGLTYHRLISAGRLRIDIEAFDITLDQAGPPEPIAAVDPLGFPASAVSGYPATLVAAAGKHQIQLHCYIVPPKFSGPAYRLYGRDGADSQGFFIYRNDRLLQAGGWNHVITADKNRALARVVIDDFGQLGDLVRMNPEKSGIGFSHELHTAVLHAHSAADGAGRRSFADYIARAESVLTESRRRHHRRKPVAEPAKGLHEDIRRVIRAEIPLRADEDPVEIRWKSLARNRFLELDREARVIYLNKHYRQMLTGGVTGLSDAPLLKTLVFLLTEEHFKGQQWGSRDKDLIDIWNEVLGTAVQTELDYRGETYR
ncbi:ATP-binding protein [Actinoplanes sp. NPDC049599]|uniref:ATP-binding protein n=1 Tax=Actinoplanes sp. NPDC049599 TaxID=3363903 RepID=UPI0037A34526